jgi:hypothetical protein
VDLHVYPFVGSIIIGREHYLICIVLVVDCFAGTMIMETRTSR